MTANVSFSPAALMESARMNLVHARMAFDEGWTNEAARLVYVASMQAAQGFVAARGGMAGDAPQDIITQYRALARQECGATEAQRSNDPRISCALANKLIEIDDRAEFLRQAARLKADYDVEPAPHMSCDLARIAWGIERAGRFLSGVRGS